MAHVYSTEGSEALRELLAHLIETDIIDRQTLIDVADKLDEAGLGEAVDLVVEAIEAIGEATKLIAKITAG